ncbi:MAG: dTDP-4-dehydrorhamnose reductase [Porphyromonadaceae bacterium]|nr:dTDP-4-dehydrorhamnose reductase [Porphyromonadaceae bacterium]
MNKTCRLIITGAEGQLGRSIQALAPSYPSIEFVYTDVKELDICRPNSLDSFAETLTPGLQTLVVNCAAYTTVDQAEEESEVADRLNHQAVRLLAESCWRLDYMMIQISTDYVFDGNASRPYAEDAPTNPLGVYGKTKRLGEEAIQQVLGSRGLVVRTAWLYSPYGRNFVLTMLRLASQREELGVVADQVGSPTYAPNLAEAVVRIAHEAVENGAFTRPYLHYTDAGVCSWYDLAYYTIKASSETQCLVRPITTQDYPTPAARPAYSVLSQEGIRTDYGIEPPHWTEGIDRLLAYLANEDQTK